MQLFLKITPAAVLLMGAAYLVWRGMSKDEVSERNADNHGTNGAAEGGD